MSDWVTPPTGLRRDCYLCVRTSPVNAVQVSGRQARLSPSCALLRAASCLPPRGEGGARRRPANPRALAAWRRVVATWPPLPAFYWTGKPATKALGLPAQLW
jgi:hypothetical protein